MEVQMLRSRMLLALVCLAVVVAADSAFAAKPAETMVTAGDPEWIWAPALVADEPLSPTAWFRKTFEVTSIESARFQVTCDDRYELYLNGRRIGTGNNWKLMQSYDLSKSLIKGRNVIAIKGENVNGTTIGLVAQLMIKAPGHTEVAYSTNNTWKTSNREVPGWERLYFNDSSWSAPVGFGELGTAEPWGDQVAAAEGGHTKRFTVAKDFRVERVLKNEATGSLIAMAFNEWGEILASRERGPLLLAIDKNQDGVPETVTTYCDKVTSTQGILALNGDVYVVGDGPNGAALYKLSDEDRDGQAEKVTALVEFEGPMGEHGPHAPALGPDGLIYIIVGNHTGVKKAFDAQSPYRHAYEGDLPQPKYEDASGQIAGTKAPGGMVIRTDTDGSFVQLYAGGLRNAYDLSFNDRGDLFTCDSDMEWDIGLPWYRPTRVNQLASGAEFGWRSGWSVWPEYYLDNLPATINTERGSPTGMEVYNHYMYPPQYHDTLFVGDWSQGQILAVHLKPAGGGYEATSEVFVQGRPLNVTDLTIGPDGWLYFATGGRGTEGGVYRVLWNGRAVPPPIKTPILKAVRQPQPGSAWARQKIAAAQEKLGADWDRQLLALVEDTSARADDRCRALGMTQLYGPPAGAKTLLKLTRDKQPSVRAKAAFLLGVQPDDTAGPYLARMLTDSDAGVRRATSDAITRGGYDVPIETLIAALADSDRFAAWAARRALEEFPVADWKQPVLDAKETRSFLVGATALLTVEPDRKTAEQVVVRCRSLMQGYLSDPDFIDLLRVLELAVVRGNIAGEALPELRRDLAREYPAGEWRMNREMLRLAAHLQEASILPRLLGELNGKASQTEKLHAAFMARYIKSGWTSDQKYALVKYLENAQKLDGGVGLAGYVDNVLRDFSVGFNESEQREALANGQQWPTAALSALVKLPEHPEPQVIRQLIELDGDLASVDTPPARRLRTGIVAILGRSADTASMDYLRQAFEEQPERRPDLAMGLAQSPDGKNWALLVRSLASLEGVAAQEVLTQLATVDKRPSGPEPVRQVILTGLKLGADGAPMALKLLEKWCGKPEGPDDQAWDVVLAGWQKWYSEQYPDAPAAVLPKDAEGSRWTEQELLAALNAPGGGNGLPRRGAVVFEKAQCIKCHRFGNRGEALGPDLSTVGMRFQKREILESILFPSHVISDQYASKTITTLDGKTYTGMIGAAGEKSIVVLQANGQKTTIARDQIDETIPSKKSAMPDGLLNQLTLEEIADLFALLMAGAK
jgi:putative heme-binding domain-containing protein